MAAALPTVDLRPRPFLPALAAAPDPLGLPRLRPDLPRPVLMASRPETPEGKQMQLKQGQQMDFLPRVKANPRGGGGVPLSPFMLSEADPDTEAGELGARDCGADDTGSSTMTSMSLLLSSASGGSEPGWSSLLREI